MNTTVVPVSMTISGSRSGHSVPAWKIVCIDDTK